MTRAPTRCASFVTSRSLGPYGDDPAFPLPEHRRCRGGARIDIDARNFRDLNVVDIERAQPAVDEHVLLAPARVTIEHPVAQPPAIPDGAALAARPDGIVRAVDLHLGGPLQQVDCRSEE